MITDCRPDARRRAPLSEAMDNYGVERDDPDWPWNVLSRRTVVYSCGAMCRDGDAVTPVHNHDPDEYARCERLAKAAAVIMAGTAVGMGSEAADYFAPFYVVASVGVPAPTALTPDSVRAAFGGTIYPDAGIVVEPLAEAGDWWRQVEADAGAMEEEDDAASEEGAGLRPWRDLIRWFGEQSDLHGASFVQIGEDPLPGENGGSVFPRLALARTESGSLVGVYGQVVHT